MSMIIDRPKDYDKDSERKSWVIYYYIDIYYYSIIFYIVMFVLLYFFILRQIHLKIATFYFSKIKLENILKITWVCAQ